MEQLRKLCVWQEGPDWLITELILSQFTNVEEPHRCYREAVQRYSGEEHLIWEDLRHGFILGSQQFLFPPIQSDLKQTLD